MSTYRLSYDQLRQSPAIGDMLSALERGFNKFSVDFYLVGALARDVWMGIHNMAARRSTSDIDFAVLIPNSAVFNELKDYLTLQEGFNTYSGNLFVFIWEDGMQVDLIPFGDIENNGTVKVAGTGFTTLTVDGFAEIHKQNLPEIELDSGNKFKVCTLPGIILLKLIAWDDRPEMRRSDILDISDILNHYFDLQGEEIYDRYSTLFDDETKKLIDISAIVLGREIGAIIKEDKSLAERIINIIEANSTTLSASKIGIIMTDYFDNTVEENVTLLKHILAGIQLEIGK